MLGKNALCVTILCVKTSVCKKNLCVKLLYRLMRVKVSACVGLCVCVCVCLRVYMCKHVSLRVSVFESLSTYLYVCIFDIFHTAYLVGLLQLKP